MRYYPVALFLALGSMLGQSIAEIDIQDVNSLPVKKHKKSALSEEDTFPTLFMTEVVLPQFPGKPTIIQTTLIMNEHDDGIPISVTYETSEFEGFMDIKDYFIEAGATKATPIAEAQTGKLQVRFMPGNYIQQAATPTLQLGVFVLTPDGEQYPMSKTLECQVTRGGGIFCKAMVIDPTDV